MSAGLGSVVKLIAAGYFQPGVNTCVCTCGRCPNCQGKPTPSRVWAGFFFRSGTNQSESRHTSVRPAVSDNVTQTRRSAGGRRRHNKDSVLERSVKPSLSSETSGLTFEGDAANRFRLLSCSARVSARFRTETDDSGVVSTFFLLLIARVASASTPTIQRLCLVQTVQVCHFHDVIISTGCDFYVRVNAALSL